MTIDYTKLKTAADIVAETQAERQARIDAEVTELDESPLADEVFALAKAADPSLTRTTFRQRLASRVAAVRGPR